MRKLNLTKIMEHFETTKELAEASFYQLDNSFDFDYGSQKGTQKESEVIFDPPPVPSIEIPIRFPACFIEDESVIYNDKSALFRALNEALEDLNSKSIKLSPGYQIIEEYGADIDHPPVVYLRINADWQENK